MTDDDARSLLAAYALDAVDDDERRAVEDLVARDPAAAAELDELQAVTAAIAAADEVPPPSALRARVLDRVGRTEQVTSSTGGTPAASTSGGTSVGADPSVGAVVPLRPRRPRVAAWGLAAAVAGVLAVTVPGVVAWQQHDRAVRAEARADLLTDLLAEPGATVLAGPLTGGGEAVAVLTEARGAVVVDGLPALEADRVYQVWAMRDGVPVPAGFLDGSAGTASEVLADYRPGDGVALSVEPAGGSPQPTTTPLVVLIPG